MSSVGSAASCAPTAAAVAAGAQTQQLQSPSSTVPSASVAAPSASPTSPATTTDNKPRLFKSSSCQSSDAHTASTPLATQKLEEELDKVRTDGDLALIKVHNLRQSIYRAEGEIATLKRRLKHHKKHQPPADKSVSPTSSTTSLTTIAATTTTTTTSTTLIPTTSSHAGVAAVNALHPHQPHPKYTASGDGGDTDAMVMSARTIHSLVQQQERLKKAISVKVTEMLQSRKEIDAVRRKRKDLLAKERFLVEGALALEQQSEEFKKELATYKDKEQKLHQQMSQLHQTMEETQEEFRSEHMRLLEELERIAHPDKQSASIHHPGKVHRVFFLNLTKSYVRPNVRQRQPFHLSRAKKMSIEQKVVSFEQKKEDLDRLVEETGITNLEEFIRTYNEQESAKSEVLSRIDAQTYINKTLHESIQALEDDTNRLNGVDEFGSSTLDHPMDLRKRIETDEGIISHWKTLAQVYADKLRIIREPICQLYTALEPEPSLISASGNNNANDTDTESNVSYQTTLQQIGIIQERAMQRILQKILQEMNNEPPSTTTLERLLRYRGRMQNGPGVDEQSTGNQPQIATIATTSAVAMTSTPTTASSPALKGSPGSPGSRATCPGRVSLVNPSEVPSIANQLDDPVQESSSHSLMDTSTLTGGPLGIESMAIAEER